MIKAEHLVKRYGANYALNDVSFEIKEGEIVGLLGPNGAGKSTAMNILTGYLSATSGSAFVNGIDILENPMVYTSEGRDIIDLLIYFAIAIVAILFVEWILQLRINFAR